MAHQNSSQQFLETLEIQLSLAFLKKVILTGNLNRLAYKMVHNNIVLASMALVSVTYVRSRVFNPTPDTPNYTP